MGNLDRSLVRQQNNCCIHQQAGRYQGETFVHASKVDLALMSHDGYQNTMSAYSRSAKSQSRSAKPQVSGNRDWVVIILKWSHHTGPYGADYTWIYLPRETIASYRLPCPRFQTRWHRQQMPCQFRGREYGRTPSLHSLWCPKFWTESVDIILVALG